MPKAQSTVSIQNGQAESYNKLWNIQIPSGHILGDPELKSQINLFDGTRNISHVARRNPSRYDKNNSIESLKKNK